MYQNVLSYFLGHAALLIIRPAARSVITPLLLLTRAGRALNDSIRQFANRSPAVIIRRAPAGNPQVRIASGVQSWAGRPVGSPQRAWGRTRAVAVDYYLT